MRSVRSGAAAVFSVFGLGGFLAGSWAGRVPALAQQVQAEPGALSLALLGITVGLLTGAPFAEAPVHGPGCGRSSPHRQ
ncbi:hypothetical protein GCM10012275_21580 [Longimycelium tulufanense]|uniref:Uncharacterized protein n=1 Tax=Longimycelium tulufanense TaxID=907463 RepID=A0A8J3FW48_9PSEU|nr:hypothetical protein [Longimycelium tulufanense]GGM50378.1 hypothetical protein GCM10012275_21580 [Longimycelium tulufanense]